MCFHCRQENNENKRRRDVISALESHLQRAETHLYERTLAGRASFKTPRERGERERQADSSDNQQGVAGYGQLLGSALDGGAGEAYDRASKDSDSSCEEQTRQRGGKQQRDSPKQRDDRGSGARPGS